MSHAVFDRVDQDADSVVVSDVGSRAELGSAFIDSVAAASFSTTTLEFRETRCSQEAVSIRAGSYSGGRLAKSNQCRMASIILAPELMIRARAVSLDR